MPRRLPQEALPWPAVALWVGGKRLQKGRESDKRTLQSRSRRNNNKEISFQDRIKVTVFTDLTKQHYCLVYETAVFVRVAQKNSFI